MDGEEKRDASKEDLGLEDGGYHLYLKNQNYINGNIVCFDTVDDDGAEDEDLDGLGCPQVVAAADEEVIEDSPADCCPDQCYARFPFLAGDDDAPFWQGWANLRLKTFQLIENKYFETAVITMILLSSLALVSIPPI